MRQFTRALITGATSGIGEAFARELPSGTHLLLTGRNAGRLTALRDELVAQGRTVETVIADLTVEADRGRLIAMAQDFGVDLLINNAGAGRFGNFLDNDVDSEFATVMVNVVAVVVLTRALLPGMIERARTRGRRAGLIVVSSAAAFTPVPMFATYAASKTFDLHFAEALAEEMRDEPVDVLALCPGATRTAFGERAGYEPGNLPGAGDPRAVARGALAAVGRETVHVSGLFKQAALAPIVRPRRLVTGAIGLAMRWLAPRDR
jgi:short-subunit dehydrogenase